MAPRTCLVLLSAAWFCVPLPGRAENPPPTPPATLPAAIPETCPAPCAPIVQKTIHTRNVYLVEKQAACTLPQLSLRAVEVCREKRPTLEITYNEQRQVCTELVLKPREIEQEVCCTEIKPVTTIDPCTGCPCTVHQAVPVTKKVKITVYDAVPEQKEYIVKTPCLKPGEQDVIVKKLVLDATTIPAIEKRMTALETRCDMNYQIAVPQPPPCPPVKGCHSCK
jgi:hypothetical protein